MIISGKRSCLPFMLFLGLASPAILADSYFVRPDGGTAQQCTGLSDQPYPGSGTSQDCAWSHPFVALPPGSAPRISGGDTLLIGEGDYRMGHGAPSADRCALDWSWDCHMPPIPSGPSADQPTRILGTGYDQGCPAAPKLWGTERARTILNLEGSSNVVLACLEVTDHASCIDFHCHNGQCGGQVAACNRASAPWGDWASTGVTATDSSNVVLRDVNIHGMANQGVRAGRLSDWTMDRVKINANGWAGWDGDIGADSANAGTLLFVDTEIAWNGCVEDWQTGDTFGCWGQGGGGYGDGLGTADSEGHWIFENARVHHNTSDGIDLLHMRDGGQITVRRSLIESNAGNQVKVSRSALIENSIIVGNCEFFQGEGNMHDSDHCRALGDTISVGLEAGGQTDLINNTIIGQGNCVISGGGGDSQSVLTLANNVIIGSPYWHDPGQQSCLYYSGSGEQIVWQNNLVKDVIPAS
ncbi:MAG: right-handed parallel beta-helix repeat-containing protein [Xanthomonadaceae bacterium]|nr:right-handed parallel beta-helix repeat-containing protein [Xanthomonadaceae bacterium]